MNLNAPIKVKLRGTATCKRNPEQVAARIDELKTRLAESWDEAVVSELEFLHRVLEKHEAR